jgi:hypothetical protein
LKSAFSYNDSYLKILGFHEMLNPFPSKRWQLSPASVKASGNFKRFNDIALGAY